MQNIKKLFQNKMGSSSNDLSNDDSGNTEIQTPTAQSVSKKLLKLAGTVIFVVVWNITFLSIESFKEDFPFDIIDLLPFELFLYTGFFLGISLLVSALGIKNERQWAYKLGRVSLTLLGVLIAVLTSTTFFAIASEFADFGSSVLTSILFGVLLTVFGLVFTLQFLMPLYKIFQEISFIENGKAVPENHLNKILKRLRKSSDEKTQAQVLESLTWKPFVITVLSITLLSLSTGPIMWGYNSFVANFDGSIKTVKEYTPIDEDEAPKAWHTVKVSESNGRLREKYYCWTGDIVTLLYVNKTRKLHSTTFGSSMVLMITGVGGFILVVLSRLGFNTFKVGIVLFMSTIGGGMLSMIAMSIFRILLGSSFGELP